MSQTVALCLQTLRESVRRRLFVVVAVATVIYLALFTSGIVLLNGHSSSIAVSPGETATALISATLFGVGMFAINFLGNVLAVFLTIATVATDADRGLLQPVIVRPVGRAQMLLSRWLATTLVTGTYSIVVYAVTLAITAAVTGWRPPELVRPGLELALGTAVMAALCLLGSVFLTFVANGIAVIMLFGLGQLGGLLGQIGHGLQNETLVHVGHGVAWALPYEAMYEQALSSLTRGASGLAGFVLQLGPLGGAEDGGTKLLVWTIAYVAAVLAIAVAAFNRKDI